MTSIAVRVGGRRGVALAAPVNWIVKFLEPDVADMGDTALPHRAAVDAFVDSVESAAVPSLRRLVLFGSVARATHEPDSDVDVLAILDESADVGDVEDELRGLAYEVALEHDVVFSIHAVTESTMAERGDHPFFENVLAEGRPVYG